MRAFWGEGVGAGMQWVGCTALLITEGLGYKTNPAQPEGFGPWLGRLLLRQSILQNRSSICLPSQKGGNNSILSLGCQLVTPGPDSTFLMLPPFSRIPALCSRRRAGAKPCRLISTRGPQMSPCTLKLKWSPRLLCDDSGWVAVAAGRAGHRNGHS